MPYSAFGITNRVAISDEIRSKGFKYYGTKGMYGPVFNQAIFNSGQDHCLGTEDQCKVQELATIYYAASGDFKDSSDAIVTLVDYDRINIIIDTMERDIVFPSVKLEFSSHNLINGAGFDITLPGESTGRIDITDTNSIINISGQSNGMKLRGDIAISLKDTETTANRPFGLFWSGEYIIALLANDGGIATYSIDTDGLLTLVDTLVVNTAVAVGASFQMSTNGNYFFIPAQTNGLYSISIDGAGNITLEDTLVSVSPKVTSFGQSYLLADAGPGIASISVDSLGSMTLADTDFSFNYSSVAVNDNYIFCGTTTAGIKTLEMDISGNLTVISSETTILTFDAGLSSAIYGNYLYVPGGNSSDSANFLHVYEINQSTGALTYIYGIPLPDPFSVFSDGNGNLFASFSTGFKHYVVMQNGTLLENDSISTGPSQISIYGSNSYIFAGNDSATIAIRNYSKGDIGVNFTGTGSIFSGGRLIQR